MEEEDEKGAEKDRVRCVLTGRGGGGPTAAVDH